MTTPEIGAPDPRIARSPLLHVLGDRELPKIRIVDIGAMLLGEPPYGALLGLPNVEVVGFEPNPEECAKLQAQLPDNHRYLPYFVGDGKERTFHWCKWAATSSLYPPNRDLLERFSDLPELVEVASTSQVSTTRLDAVAEIESIDFLKIDVQGATLDVLHGGAERVKGALVVQAEAEFVPLYEGEPLFGDIDAEMRRLGYLFHRFAGLSGRTFAPLRKKAGAGAAGQLLWTDGVFVRSFLRFSTLSPEQLLKLALILDLVYESRDLALLALQHHDHQTGDELWERYIQTLTGEIKDRPPLLL